MFATDSATIGQYAWYEQNSNSRTQAVVQKRLNAYRLYDMSGYVWEWCWDWKDTYPSYSQTDPVGPSSGSGRVARGGGWGHSSSYLRSTYRDGNLRTTLVVKPGMQADRIATLMQSEYCILRTLKICKLIVVLA